MTEAEAEERMERLERRVEELERRADGVHRWRDVYRVCGERLRKEEGEREDGKD